MITPALIAHQFTQQSRQEAIYHSLAHTEELSPQCWVHKRLHDWEERLPIMHRHLPEHLSHCDIIHLQASESKLIPSLWMLPQSIILDIEDSFTQIKKKSQLYHCLQRIPKLTLVTSSQEKTQELAGTPLFKGRAKYCIPQPIDCQEFHPRPRLICKESLGIAPQMQVIAIRCENRQDKQSEETIQSICQQLHQRGILGLHILLLGKDKAPPLPYPCSCIYMEEQSSHARSRLYNAINILIHLSQAQKDETHLLEAMACRLAIIATRNATTQEHIHNNMNGHIVEEESPSAIVHHLLILLRAPVLREHYGLHARNTIIKNHDEQRVGKLYKKLYKELL